MFLADKAPFISPIPIERRFSFLISIVLVLYLISQGMFRFLKPTLSPKFFRFGTICGAPQVRKERQKMFRCDLTVRMRHAHNCCSSAVGPGALCGGERRSRVNAYLSFLKQVGQGHNNHTTFPATAAVGTTHSLRTHLNLRIDYFFACPLTMCSMSCNVERS